MLGVEAEAGEQVGDRGGLAGWQTRMNGGVHSGGQATSSCFPTSCSGSLPQGPHQRDSLLQSQVRTSLGWSPSPPGMSAVCVWWGPKDLAQLMGPHPDCTWDNLVRRCDAQAAQADQVRSSTVWEPVTGTRAEDPRQGATAQEWGSGGLDVLTPLP